MTINFKHGKLESATIYIKTTSWEQNILILVKSKTIVMCIKMMVISIF